jgi:uncharacterized protein (UPF0335 family)
MQNEIEEFAKLSDQLKKLDEKKIRLEEQYKNKKDTLTELLREIKAEGYDPMKLKEIIQEKEALIKSQVATFSEEMNKVSAMIASIEV